MKNLTQLLCCIILILGFSTPTQAQGWEIFVSNLTFPTFSSGYKILLGANNGFRLANEDTWTGVTNILDYDANGDYIGEYGVLGANNWTLIQSDNSGATYWWADYKIRKIDVNNQVVWTFNTNNTTGAFWAYPGPNGSTYAQNRNNNGNYIIDVINKDGVLGHRFNFNPSGSFDYFPTDDLGMIYIYQKVRGLGLDWIIKAKWFGTKPSKI
jgi:hypothetical protein